jgi:ribosomal protein S18 acetylase RimI-like enzyme
MAPQAPRIASTFRTKDSAPFTIRIAIPEDATFIQHIGSTVFATTFGHSMPAEDLKIYLEDAYSLQSVLNDIQIPSKTVCVACDARNQVVGFATLTEGTIEDCVRSAPAPIELQRLYVDSAAHGQGVGGALMKHAEDIAKDRGFQTCWLGVWEENHKAQKMYERLGYRKVGDHDFVMGKEIQTDWILIKEL